MNMENLLKWAIWAMYMMGIFNVVTWLVALDAPPIAWFGLATMMFGSGLLNAGGYPFGPEIMRKSRRELLEQRPPRKAA